MCYIKSLANANIREFFRSFSKEQRLLNSGSLSEETKQKTLWYRGLQVVNLFNHYTLSDYLLQNIIDFTPIKVKKFDILYPLIISTLSWSQKRCAYYEKSAYLGKGAYLGKIAYLRKWKFSWFSNFKKRKCCHHEKASETLDRRGTLRTKNCLKTSNSVLYYTIFQK